MYVERKCSVIYEGDALGEESGNSLGGPADLCFSADDASRVTAIGLVILVLDAGHLSFPMVTASLRMSGGSSSELAPCSSGGTVASSLDASRSLSAFCWSDDALRLTMVCTGAEVRRVQRLDEVSMT